MNASIPLTQLRSGQSATILGFSPDIAPQCRKLLQHLGIHRQTAITLIRRAPLGDPLQLQVLGSQFSLRSSEACHIYVEYSN
ncbi:MAG: ferrous iron transport protein A [Candidatus Aquirickettsiella gammari]|jgi:ferrous iron transport protein A|uniref:Ferrous iron transport protein A n=1 Tax=Candidatus Aquirickettsiella gammari TaxID=2016198 RepID=A0A370CG81_9COXI|nr:MAG: ferrous iron transport protein A [Candidatus Aquirickettsiella gammari]